MCVNPFIHYVICSLNNIAASMGRFGILNNRFYIIHVWDWLFGKKINLENTVICAKSVKQVVRKIITYNIRRESAPTKAQYFCNSLESDCFRVKCQRYGDKMSGF